MGTTDFTPGDVFLFEHDNTCISRLISLLSNSPISHAAMYFKDGEIVEEASPTTGIRTKSVEGLKNAARLIHVRRYYRSDESAQALVNAAQKHLDAKQPYSLGNLVMVGVLLIFNQWKPEARRAVKNLLSLICILLAKAIDARTGGQGGATCSQLVYEVYRDAGFRLHIVHKNAATGAESLRAAEPQSLAMETLAEVEAGNITDVELLEQNQVDASGSFDMEKLCCVILAVLEGGKNDTAMHDAVSPKELHALVARFASLLYHLAHPAPAQNAFGGDLLKRALRYFIEHYAGFVSPGDLYASCPDIKEEIAVLGKEE